MSSDITNGQNRQSRRSRPAAKAAKPKDGREKITLLISKETNVKLSTLAALKGVDRSTLADSILTEALRGVVISLRGSLAGGAGEGGAETADRGGLAAWPEREKSGEEGGEAGGRWRAPVRLDGNEAAPAMRLAVDADACQSGTAQR